MAGASTHLVFDGVTKTFDDRPVVDDVSIDVDPGERVAIVGPSGAGKTTLLRLANGSLRADSGQVTVAGAPATSDAVALAYQGETLVDRRSALANVLSGRVGDLPWWRGLLEPLSPRNPGPAMALLDAVGLADRVEDRVDTLSAGERQRVAFARALVQDAPIVLADEPTANLDPASRENVLEVLDSVAGERTLLTVLHDVDLARSHYGRLVGLADGQVHFDAAATDVTDAMLGELFAAGESTPRHGTGGHDTASGRTEGGSSGTVTSPEREVPWDV